MRRSRARGGFGVHRRHRRRGADGDPPRGCSPGRRTVDEGLVLREEVGEETYRLLYHRYDDGPDPGFSPAIELFRPSGAP